MKYLSYALENCFVYTHTLFQIALVSFNLG